MHGGACRQRQLDITGGLTQGQNPATVLLYLGLQGVKFLLLADPARNQYHILLSAKASQRRAHRSDVGGLAVINPADAILLQNQLATVGQPSERLQTR